MSRRIGFITALTVLFCAIAASASVPSIAVMSPTNNAVEVDPDTSLVLTFDQDISTNTGNITVTNITQGTGVVIPTGDSQLAVAASNLTISLDTPLSIYGDTYAVMIDSGAITDTNAVPNAFGGITDTTTWRFTSTTNGNWALVAYWPLNDGTNGETVATAAEIINDSVYPASDGAIHGSGGTWAYDSELEKIVYNTTEADLLKAGNMSITKDFTWQAWIKATDGGTMMGTRDGTYFRFTPGNVNGSWAGTFDFSPNGNDGTWHHMLLRRSGSTITVWIDGSQLSGSLTKSGTLNNTFQIAGTSRYTDFLSGRMSDVAIWDEALTAERIQQLASGHDVIMDITSPTIASLSPTNSAVAVPVGDNLIVTFDDVITTNTGDIVITNLTDSTGVVITVPGSDPDGIITVDGTNLVINPDVNLDPTNLYAVLIHPGAIENEYGYDFSGITDTSTWQFTTAEPDTTDPTISSLEPTNGEGAWPVAGNLVATFDENVELVNGGVITITNLTDNTGTNITLPDAQVSVLNTTVTINPDADMDFGDLYAVQISATAIDDTSANSFAGILDTTTWRFTADTRPAHVSFVPNDNATEVITSTNLSITFDKDVVALAGGVISITNLTDSTVKNLVLQDDNGAVPGTQDDRLTIVGATVSINQRSNLEYGDNYAVLIDANAFEDTFGQGFSGITNVTTWNFSTDPDMNANLTAYWPLTDGTNGQLVSETGADDLIDDPSHGAIDATETGSGNTWTNDTEMGRIVLRTVDGGRLYAGSTQIFAYWVEHFNPKY